MSGSFQVTTSALVPMQNSLYITSVKHTHQLQLRLLSFALATHCPTMRCHVT